MKLPSLFLFLSFVCVSSSCSDFSLCPSPAAGATASPCPSSLDGGYPWCPAHIPLPIHPLGPTRLSGLCACLWQSAYLCPPGPAPETGRRKQQGGHSSCDSRMVETGGGNRPGAEQPKPLKHVKLSPASSLISCLLGPPSSATCQGPGRGGGGHSTGWGPLALLAPDPSLSCAGPLARKIPGQAEATCLPSKACAIQAGSAQTFPLIPMLPAQTKPHKSGGEGGVRGGRRECELLF